VAKVEDLGGKSIGELGLSPEVANALRDVVAELGDNYRDAFVAMVQAINRQASALERIQNTLGILIEKLAPELTDRLPAAITVAQPGTQPDLASAIIVADPIGTGFTLSQEALAQALGIPATAVSVLARALGLRKEDCAVVVRRGGRSETVNYHARAVARFRELVEAADQAKLNPEQRSALKRVRAIWSQKR